jgi:hypothetical protein
MQTKNSEFYKMRLSISEINTIVNDFIKDNPNPKGPLAVKLKLCEAQVSKILEKYTLTPKN